MTSRVPTINFDQSPLVPGCFVFELAHKRTPTDVGNGFGKRGMLQHVLDGEALDDDRLVLTDQVCRKLVLVVSASIGDARMDPRDTAALLLAVLRALLLAGQFALATSQLLFITRKILGIRKRLPIGSYHQGFQSQIDADLLLLGLKWRDIFLNQKGDKVAARLIAETVTVGGVAPSGKGRDQQMSSDSAILARVNVPFL